jgi:hypothetical protein
MKVVPSITDKFSKHLNNPITEEKVMKGRDTFGNAIRKVHEVSAKNHDETVAVSDMAFEGLNTMQIAGTEVEVLPSAQRLFANRLRLPYSYLVPCQVKRDTLYRMNMCCHESLQT